MRALFFSLLLLIACTPANGADPADPHWRRSLALSMGLFALVPLLDGHVATGGGLLALFSGLLVLRLVVDAEAHGRVGPPR